jgi:dihydropteroate synthase type 2
MRKSRPQIVGIVNVTADSFSDGGRFLQPADAIAHARALAAAGADVIELGAASSHPDSAAVSAEVEIERLEPILGALADDGLAISIDSDQPAVQAYCLERGVAYLNDIHGFPDPSLHSALAAAKCGLVVMHSIQAAGRATRRDARVDDVRAGVQVFFEERIAELVAAGVSRDRLILDPGMGFFLGSTPAPSIAVLNALPELRARFGLPVMVCVSRKSFLGALVDRPTLERGPATLAAELVAAQRGVDFIRTHDVAALRDALTIAHALSALPTT